METNTAINYLTNSLVAARKASADNRALGGVVVLAKFNKDDSVVLEARFPNRREPHYRVGYCRFGAKPIWCADKKFTLGIAYLKTSSGESLDAVVLKQDVEFVVQCANRVIAARAANAT